MEAQNASVIFEFIIGLHLSIVEFMHMLTWSRSSCECKWIKRSGILLLWASYFSNCTCGFNNSCVLHSFCLCICIACGHVLVTCSHVLNWRRVEFLEVLIATLLGINVGSIFCLMHHFCGLGFRVSDSTQWNLILLGLELLEVCFNLLRCLSSPGFYSCAFGFCCVLLALVFNWLKFC